MTIDAKNIPPEVAEALQHKNLQNAACIVDAVNCNLGRPSLTATTLLSAAINGSRSGGAKSLGAQDFQRALQKLGLEKAFKLKEVKRNQIPALLKDKATVVANIDPETGIVQADNPNQDRRPPELGQSVLITGVVRNGSPVSAYTTQRCGRAGAVPRQALIDDRHIAVIPNDRLSR